MLTVGLLMPPLDPRHERTFPAVGSGCVAVRRNEAGKYAVIALPWMVPSRNNELSAARFPRSVAEATKS